MTHAAKYFVGIGTPRCGTAWLAQRFERFPKISISSVAEIHLWSLKYSAYQRGLMRGYQALQFCMRLLAMHSFRHPLVSRGWIAAYQGMMAHHEADSQFGHDRQLIASWRADACGLNKTEFGIC